VVNPALNTPDLTQSAEGPTASVPKGDQYATRHNPFAYFHSIIDAGDCNTNMVNLDQLTPRPEVRGHHAGLRLYHAQSLPRWPRCALQDRGTGRPGLGRPIPADLGARNHLVAGVSQERTIDDSVR
jgi:hypothetical protein